MRFPDRPVMNAVLGIVCALAVLALLTYPLLATQNFPAQSLSPAKNANSNNDGLYNVPSAQTTSASAALTTATNASYVVQQTTGAAASTTNMTLSGVPVSSQFSSNASAGGAQSGTVQTSSFSAGSSSSGTSNQSSSLASSTPKVRTSVTETASTIVQASTPVVPTSPTPTLTTTEESNQLVSGSAESSPAGLLNTLALLSVGALAIAAGSMFFVYRRVNSEGS